MADTKEALLAYRTRWALVEQRQTELLRAQTQAEKLAQTAALMASIDAMGWRERMDAETEAVRERWIELKRRVEASRGT
jgi:hypothetical protein